MPDTKIAFSLHVAKHDAAALLLDRLGEGEDVEAERTDRGYEGVFTGPLDTFLAVCGDNCRSLRTVCVAYTDTDGAHGIAYDVTDNELVVARESRENDPNTWHGLVYDGMRVTPP